MIIAIRNARIRFPALLLTLGMAASTAACTSAGAVQTSVPIATASDAVASPALWAPVSDLSAFDSASVTDVISNGSGFVAVGNVSQNGATNGAIWTSADGLTWNAVPIAAPQTSFMRIGHVGTGLVAMGSRCAGTGECIGTIFWSSPDGTSWSKHSEDQCCWIQALASGTFGVIGVGTDWSNFSSNGETDVAVYYSRDGATWSRPASDKSFQSASMGAVAAGGPGLVALGNGPTSLMEWTSVDGTGWSSADSTHSLGTGEVRDMLNRGSAFVAVGRDGSGAVSWVSPDGTKWSRTPDEENGLQGAVMERLASTSSQIVAVGKDSSTGAGAIWMSADGLTWTTAPSLPGASVDLNAIAASGTTLVIFGTNTNESVVVLRGQRPS